MVFQISLILSLFMLVVCADLGWGQVLCPVTMQCCATGLKSHETVPSVKISYCFSAALLSN